MCPFCLHGCETSCNSDKRPGLHLRTVMVLLISFVFYKLIFPCKSIFFCSAQLKIVCTQQGHGMISYVGWYLVSQYKPLDKYLPQEAYWDKNPKLLSLLFSYLKISYTTIHRNSCSMWGGVDLWQVDLYTHAPT